MNLFSVVKAGFIVYSSVYQKDLHSFTACTDSSSRRSPPQPQQARGLLGADGEHGSAGDPGSHHPASTDQTRRHQSGTRPSRSISSTILSLFVSDGVATLNSILRSAHAATTQSSII